MMKSKKDYVKLVAEIVSANYNDTKKSMDCHLKSITKIRFMNWQRRRLSKR